MGGKSSKTSKERDVVLAYLHSRRLELEAGRTQDEGSGYTCSHCSKRPQPHYRCHLGCGQLAHPHPLCRERMSSNEKKQTVAAKATTTSDLLLNAFALFAKRPLFASINAEKQLQWVTYRELFLRICALGRGLRGRLERSAFVAIGGDSAVWLIADYACQLFGLISVPLHTHLPAERLTHILDQCKPAIILCSRSLAERLGPECRTPIFLLDAEDSDPRSIHTLEVEGHSRPLEFDPRRGAELLTVVWTSGSTGDAKGVMISEQLYFSEVAAPWFLPYDLRRIFFSPLAHTTDRKNATITLLNGGQALLYPGPMESLLSAIALIRPTAFTAPPRLWNELYNQYQEAMAAQRDKSRETADKLQADFRRLLGGQIRTVSTGGAPIAPAVQKWIEVCFQVGLTIAYGSTEAGGIASRERTREGTEVKLIPLPDLGYTLQDTPHPRGEIAVKKAGILGYWGDAARNAAAFTADGFYKTGDIGELTEAGALRIVGRVGGAVKLAQSEWVNAEGIETELSACAWVAQVFVHAASIRSYVVAVVVPSEGMLASFVSQRSLPSTLSRAQLCARSDLRTALLAALTDHATKAKLRSWEIPRAVHVECERFSLQSGLLTPSHKLSRPALCKRYQSILDELYNTYDAETAKASSSMAEFIAQSVARGAAVIDTTRLADIGVDSLAALRLRMLLKAKTGRDVPLESLLGHPVGELCKLLAMPVSADVMLGNEPSVDWVAEAALPPLVLPPAVPSDPPLPLTVLLTGATGFVGAFILDALLRSAIPYNVVCLVRGSDSAHAARRLDEALATYGLDGALRANSVRVAVARGDVSEERLGLGGEFDALASAVSVIIHAAATVSAVLPYSHQRRANVTGTMNVLRFATGRRLKAVHHVSTMSVFSSSEKAVGAIDERTEPHAGNVGGRPAYGQSKWVAERLVRAAAKAGVPCAVYRLAGVAGSARRPFATNLSDFTFRLLTGCCQLGVAPEMPESTFDLTPVDWVAAALVALVRHCPEPSGAQVTYHLTSPCGAVSFRELIASCAKGLAPMKTVPFSEWRAVLDSAPAGNVLAPLRHCFPAPLGGAGNYRCELTQQALQRADPDLRPLRLRTRRHLRWAKKAGFMDKAQPMEELKTMQS